MTKSLTDPAERALADVAIQRERMTEIEIRYTHLTDVVEQLSELVRAQQTALDGLRVAVERMAQRVGPGSEDDALDTSHQKPPHY